MQRTPLGGGGGGMQNLMHLVKAFIYNSNVFEFDNSENMM